MLFLLGVWVCGFLDFLLYFGFLLLFVRDAVFFLGGWVLGLVEGCEVVGVFVGFKSHKATNI